MAEPLKNHFGPEIPKRISKMISDVHPEFPSRPFINTSLKGYDGLELLDRGRKIADALREHLPDDYPEAVAILVKSIGPTLEEEPNKGMGSFLYMPHTMFVQRHGLDHFEESMVAQYELTQRFTAESSIRPFIEKYPKKSLARLRKWTRDGSEHVRRLVSEGTRPRLPWSSRLRMFQEDPTPVIELLELLKDDESLYVRRSVANNLNDIGKDNPEVLYKTAARWLKDASPEREWVVKHALRSAIKRGEAGALKVIGYAGSAKIDVSDGSILPEAPTIGDSIKIRFTATNNTSRRQKALVDLQIHFVKSNGSTSAKVFKLKEVELAAGQSETLGKTVSLKQHTTRKHFPGLHRVDALLNGEAVTVGSFELNE